MKNVQTLCYLCVFLLAFVVHRGVSGLGTTREEVIETYARRKKQLQDLLDGTNSQLADHESGMRRLDEEEHAKLTKRAGLYQKKLDTMPDVLDDKEIERMIEREKKRQERYDRHEL